MTKENKEDNLLGASVKTAKQKKKKFVTRNLAVRHSIVKSRRYQDDE